MQRALPLWRERIEPDLRSGKTVLVVAHGNSLRGLVKHVDGVSDEAIVDVRTQRLFRIDGVGAMPRRRLHDHQSVYTSRERAARRFPFPTGYH